MKTKLISILCLAAMLMLLLIPAGAYESHDLVVDEADLLTDGEEALLTAKLEKVSKAHDMDIVVLTVDSLDGKSAEAYADDYYDYNGYGQGSDHDGILLLVAMGSHDWHISTTGAGISVFTDSRIEYLGDQFVPYLSDGEYYDGFSAYCETCDSLMSASEEGDYSVPSTRHPLTYLVIALLGGFVLALIPMAVLRKQIKNVEKQELANNYLVEGSLRLRVSDDRFIRKEVHRVAKPKDNGGGSSTHTGSSGTSHGGGGGKF